MLLKRVLKHKTSFICYFEFHDLYLFTFSRLKSLPCPSSTNFAGQLAHVIGPLKCYNDDYQCYDYQKMLSTFYPHIRVLPSRPSGHPSGHSSGCPSVSAFYPYPLVRRLITLCIFCVTVNVCRCWPSSEIFSVFT